MSTFALLGVAVRDNKKIFRNSDTSIIEVKKKIKGNTSRFFRELY